MKIARRSETHLVLTHYRPFLRVVGACLLVGAGLLFSLKSTGQRVECDAGAGEPVCTFIETTLAGVGTTSEVAADDVRAIEVVKDTEGEDSYCVLVRTDDRAHQFGRCSLTQEPHLEETATRLRAFYAGEVPSVRNQLSDAGFVWLHVAILVVLGLVMLGLGTSRLEIDKPKGELRLQRRSWLLGRSRCLVLPIASIANVEILSGIGAEGDERMMVAHLGDGQRIDLHAASSRTLERELEAIREFLERGPTYR